MTRSGVGAVVCGALLLAAGTGLGWSTLSLVGAGLLAAVVLALALVVRPWSVQVDRQVAPPRVPKGEPAIAYLTYANRGWAAAASTLAHQPFGDGAVATVIPRLRRGERGLRTYRLPTTRRGVFEVGPVEVVRRDPFAFFRLARRHGDPQTIWVQPRVLPLRVPPAGRRRHLEGPTSDTSPQGTVTFHRLRDYVEGDDLRLVHWPSSARAGTLVVRQNVDTSQPYSVVLLDLRAAAYAGDAFEDAVDVAASAVVATGGERAPVELRTTAGTRLGGSRQRDVTPLVDHLTAVTAQDGAAGSLREELLALRRLRGGTTLVVVTGAVDPADLVPLTAVRRRFDRVVLVAVTAEPVPRLAGVRVLAGEDADAVAAAWNLDGVAV